MLISLKFLSIAGPHDLWKMQTQGAELSTVQGCVQGAQAGLCREDAGDGASALQVYNEEGCQVELVWSRLERHEVEFSFGVVECPNTEMGFDKYYLKP